MLPVHLSFMARAAASVRKNTQPVRFTAPAWVRRIPHPRGIYLLPLPPPHRLRLQCTPAAKQSMDSTDPAIIR